MRICFATYNFYKLQEIQAFLGRNFKIISLQALGEKEPLLKTQTTLAANSLEKAAYVFNN